jgi:hypothetical protein
MVWKHAFKIVRTYMSPSVSLHIPEIMKISSAWMYHHLISLHYQVGKRRAVWIFGNMSLHTFVTSWILNVRRLHWSIVSWVGMKFSIGAKRKIITHGFCYCWICLTKDFQEYLWGKVWQIFCNLRKLP